MDGADIVITATTVKQINDSLKTTKVKNVINAKDEITITIESAGLKVADGDTIVIPGGLDDKVLNFAFTKTFAETKGLLTILDDRNLDEFNITLPNGNIGQLAVATTHATTTVVSAGTTQVEFSADIDSKKLTLGNGIEATVTDDISGKVYADGADIVALVVESNKEVTKDGVSTKVLDTKDKKINVKELVIRGEVEISNNIDDLSKEENLMDKYTIEEGDTLISNDFLAVKEVVGTLKSGSITSVLTLGGNSNLYYAKKVSNVAIETTANYNSFYIYALLNNCKIGGCNKYYIYNNNSIENVEFTKANTIYFQNNPESVTTPSYTFTFKNVSFPSGVNIGWEGKTFYEQEDGADKEVEFYYWFDYDPTYEVAATDTLSETANLDDFVAAVEKNPYRQDENTGVYKYRKILKKTAAEVKYYDYALTVPNMSRTFKDIPAGLRKLDDGGVWVGSYTDYKNYYLTQYNTYGWAQATNRITEGKEWDGFTLTIAYDGCKYNSKSLTVDNISSDFLPTNSTMNMRYLINGKLYKRIQGTANSWLEEVEED